MAAETVLNHKSTRGEHKPEPAQRWLTLLTWVLALVLIALAIWMRLHDLGLPFDRDSYDEGVYWQSLRSMSQGYALYGQVFYSQPPLFLLSIFPTYMLAGQTLWSARLGIAIVSLLGLVGAGLLGKALNGRIGAIAGLLLLICIPQYLGQSQTIQAEAPSAALSLLSVGLAYWWWEKPEGKAGYWLAALTCITLVLSIMSKLLAVTTLVPVVMLMLAHLWRKWRGEQMTPMQHLTTIRSLWIGVAAFILTTLLLLLPFTASMPQFWQTVVSFHTVAGTILSYTRAGNKALILQNLTSLSSYGVITYAALIGTILALLRRDWRVLPLFAWFVVTIIVLWRQAPLFQHHLIALIPPLVGLILIGFGRFARSATIGSSREARGMMTKLATALMGIVLLVTIILNVQGTLRYYQAEQVHALSAATTYDIQVAKDLQRLIPADRFVVTDAQFVAALANRDTPPALVDTSSVRIETGYVTAQQLIQEASQPRVQAVLFYTHRLSTVTAFHTWVSQHFRLVRDYGSGRELWIKL